MPSSRSGRGRGKWRTRDYVALGSAAGLTVPAWLQLPPEQAADGALWGVAVGAVLGYLWACRRRAFKPCPRCGGATRDTDADKNYGMRPECRVCHGRPWPRPGTRLLMAFGYRPRT